MYNNQILAYYIKENLEGISPIYSEMGKILKKRGNYKEASIHFLIACGINSEYKKADVNQLRISLKKIGLESNKAEQLSNELIDLSKKNGYKTAIEQIEKNNFYYILNRV